MPTEIRFYHLQTSLLEDALPSLLLRTLDKGWRAVVQASSPERVAHLNGFLWTFADDSFLPHGSAKEGNEALQPVFLTDKTENPNSAQVLMLVDGAIAETMDGFELVCVIFDGGDAEALSAARADWKRYKAYNTLMTYWQQTEEGWRKAQ